MKYKFEGLLCLGVFSAGVVWSRIIFPTDFWKVDNIHDLFEIFGAVATSIAVYIAATWKKQLGTARDYELARQVAVVAFQYKESIVEVWGAADDCLQHFSAETGMDSVSKDAFTVSVESHIESARIFRSQIQALLVECRVIWKNGLDEDFAQIIGFEEACAKCIRLYLAIISPSIHPVDAITAKYQFPKFKDFLKVKGFGSRDEAKRSLDVLFEPIYEKLETIMK